MSIVGYILAILIVLVLLSLIGFWLFSRNVADKVKAAVPQNGDLTPVAGGVIHSVEAGEGPPIVLIHGLSGNLHNFLYSCVAPLARNNRVIVIDRPGCGYSKRDGVEQARLPEQARMIAEFLKIRGIEKPLLVGHSLGGAVSLALALDYPDQVGGLALISPLTAAQDGKPGVFNMLGIANPVIRKLVAETLAIPLSIRNGPKVVSAIFAPDEAPIDFQLRGGGLLTLQPEAFFAASTDFNAVSVDLSDQQARYGELKLPIGILYGDQDKVLDPDTHISRVKEACPEMELTRLPNTGHMPIVVETDKTVEFVLRQALRTFAA